MERLVILKDGTIPVAVARIVAVDHGADLESYAEELAESNGGGVHSYVELFEVEDGSTYVTVTWDEFSGYTVAGWNRLDWALDHVADADRPGDLGRPDEYEREKHWTITYGVGDDESYGHVFAI